MPRNPEHIYHPGDITILKPGTEIDIGAFEPPEDPIFLKVPTKFLILSELTNGAYIGNYFVTENGVETRIDEPRHWHQPEGK